jgi:hypothetical protein
MGAVPHLRTEITEIVTGLGTLGHADPGVALQHRPPQLRNVDDGAWDRVVEAWGRRDYGPEFHAAFRNGVAFLRSAGGLRGKVPALVEWKGAQRPPAYERVPADLRIDHVYLVSCKYLSKILHNSAPVNLFDHNLDPGAARSAAATDWYDEVAAEEHWGLLAAVRAEVGGGVGLRDLPDRPAELTGEPRGALREALRPGWPGAAAEAYRALSEAVSGASAARWQRQLGRRADREEMVWRLLRLQSAPYFVLGTSDDAVLRVRVGTPWDWRQRFDLLDLAVTAEQAGQPRVGWSVAVHDRETDSDRTAHGHVEVRWSHGRFARPPEAKVYLDTPHRDVPGYFPLEDR